MNKEHLTKEEFSEWKANHWQTHCVQQAKFQAETKKDIGWLKWLNRIIVSLLLAQLVLRFFGVV